MAHDLFISYSARDKAVANAVCATLESRKIRCWIAPRGGPLSGGYRYAASNTADEVAWYEDNSGGRTHPVGQKNANELGLYDMSGNAWEWCPDWYGENYYPQSPRENPRGPPSGYFRVVRGGSWGVIQVYTRCACRFRYNPVDRFNNLGFRVAE